MDFITLNPCWAWLCKTRISVPPNCDSALRYLSLAKTCSEFTVTHQTQSGELYTHNATEIFRPTVLLENKRYTTQKIHCSVIWHKLRHMTQLVHRRRLPCSSFSYGSLFFLPPILVHPVAFSRFLSTPLLTPPTIILSGPSYRKFRFLKF